jgi:hypothetical protein
MKSYKKQLDGTRPVGTVREAQQEQAMGNRTLRLSASMIAAIAGTAAAQPCTPSWSAMGAGQNQPVNGLVMHDDGGGMDLYAGGTFSGTAGNRVARWDGAAWSTLGTGLNNGVISLLSFNDGTGPALYVGGVFLMAGGAPATRVAKWDGNAWSALGAGLSSNVASLCVYNDGNGPAIYAGGVFVMSGTTSVNRIAKWNGTDWLPLGNGVDGTIQQLLAHDDGSGSALYACGFFTLADSVPGTAYLARWNGLTWSPVSTELPIDGVVRAIGEFDDGTGNALYAAIDWYAIPTGVPVSRVAKWDGAAWSDVGPPA